MLLWRASAKGSSLENALQKGLLEKDLRFHFFIPSMAKKSMIARERKRQALVRKYAERRLELKEILHKDMDPKSHVLFIRELQELPRNSAPVRLHNRCLITGRPRGFFRAFGLSRHVLREMAHEGLLPGVTKSSW